MVDRPCRKDNTLADTANPVRCYRFDPVRRARIYCDSGLAERLAGQSTYAKSMTDAVASDCLDMTPAQLTEALNTCFEGYLVPFVITPDYFERRFRPESLDSLSSRIWRVDGVTAAIVLIARRGWTARVAAMAVAPPFRRLGLGFRAMKSAVEDATQRGDRRLVLEVIEQNEAAIRLYESVGMSRCRRLVGYRREADSGKRTGIVEVDPLQAARALSQFVQDDLIWDLTPETLSSYAAPTKAYTIDERGYVIATGREAGVVVWSLFVDPGHRREGLGRRLIDGLAETTGGKPLLTPVAVPDTVAPGFFRACGFTENPISQFEMVLGL